MKSKPSLQQAVLDAIKQKIEQYQRAPKAPAPELDWRTCKVLVDLLGTGAITSDHDECLRVLKQLHDIAEEGLQTQAAEPLLAAIAMVASAVRQQGEPTALAAVLDAATVGALRLIPETPPDVYPAEFVQGYVVHGHIQPSEK